MSCLRDSPDRFDLDELARVAEHAHAEKRASPGGGERRDEALDHLARLCRV